MAVSENWAYLLEPGLREIFDLQVQALAAESRIPLLFNEMTSQRAFEYFLGVGGMGDWKTYAGAIEYDDLEQGYRATITPSEFVLGFKIERKLVDDDQYNLFADRPRQLAMSGMRKREKDAASVFNNAFSASYVGGDAAALCSSSHPQSPLNATTQDNAGTSTLSYDNLISTRRLMREFKDDRGELIYCNPDTLLVPPELEQTAWEIFNTIGNKPNTTDTVGNFARSWLRRVVTWDYLTDAETWWLLDSQMAKIHLRWINRMPMEFALDPTSDFDLESRWRGYQRYGYGWSDWRWVYGHTS